VPEPIEQQIAHRLESSVNSVRLVRSGGPIGRACAAGLAARYGLIAARPLGEQLAEREVLLHEEGEWLDELTPQ
jgi:hypothetical protein